MDPALYGLSDPNPLTAPHSHLMAHYTVNKILLTLKNPLLNMNVREMQQNRKHSKILSVLQVNQLGSALGTHSFSTAFSLSNIFQYLYNTNGIIHSKHIMANDIKWHEPWDPNKPFKSMFQNLELCQIYEMQAGNPYTKEQIINKANIDIIYNGRYYTELKENDGKFNNPNVEDCQPSNNFS